MKSNCPINLTFQESQIVAVTPGRSPSLSANFKVLRPCRPCANQFEPPTLKRKEFVRTLNSRSRLRSRLTSRGCYSIRQNRSELCSFLNQFLDCLFLDHPRLFRQTKQVTSLAHLLQRNLHLMAKVRSAVCAATFFVVSTRSSSQGPRHLDKHIPYRLVLLAKDRAWSLQKRFSVDPFSLPC